VVNGSPTKTQMVDGAGGHSQISQLTTSVLVLLVLLFLTKPLAYMPNAVLAAVVFYIGVELIDIKGMHAILTQRPPEFWVALITAATVVVIGVEQAIFLAMVLSLLEHVRRGYQPRNTVLAPEEVDGEQAWRSVPVTAAVEAVPGLLIYRFNHSLYYANSEQLSEEVLDLVNGADPPLSWFCIDAAAIDDVDWSSGAIVRQVFGLLKARGVRLVFAEVSADVRAELDRYGVTKLAGENAFYRSVAAAMVAYGKRHSPANEPTT
jgi:MFS superfamily sulfate permease-like transporter